MKMPNNNQSLVAEKKITLYLLSDTHEQGKNKAAFFKRFGFDISDIETFKSSLLQHSIEREIEEKTETEYGEKYLLKCELQTPDNRNPCIVTVWIIENGHQRPTLVTAYPAS